MALPQQEKWTESQYLVFERESDLKHEFMDGEVYVMSGASRPHNVIVGNIIAAIHPQLRRQPCEVYPSDMKVRSPVTGSYFYPDITVACDSIEVDPTDGDILLNPIVVIEVLSSSTEGYDRGKKFLRYRELESLQEYVLISQDAPHIECFRREADGGWHFQDAMDDETEVDLISIDCTLRLADVYERISFDSIDDKTKL